MRKGFTGTRECHCTHHDAYIHKNFTLKSEHGWRNAIFQLKGRKPCSSRSVRQRSTPSPSGLIHQCRLLSLSRTSICFAAKQGDRQNLGHLSGSRTRQNHLLIPLRRQLPDGSPTTPGLSAVHHVDLLRGETGWPVEPRPSQWFKSQEKSSSNPSSPAVCQMAPGNTRFDCREPRRFASRRNRVTGRTSAISVVQEPGKIIF